MADKVEITFNLLDTSDEIQRKIMQAIRDELNTAFPKIAKKVEDAFASRILKNVFLKANETESILDGPLNAHFGLRKGTETGVIDAILFALQTFVSVSFRRVSLRGAGLSGGLTLSFKADYDKLYALPEAEVTTAKGQVLPWLKWLLEEGDSIIIAEYGIDFGPHPRSRSGEAIMVADSTKAWRVPPLVSGTSNNNWITRMITNNEKFITSALASVTDLELDKVF